MKNIQVIGGALNAVYDIFARGNEKELDEDFARLGGAKIPKRDAMVSTAICKISGLQR